MPAAHELPDELSWLAINNASPPCEGDNWHSDQQWLDDFHADVDAAVPCETTPLDLECLEKLAVICKERILKLLGNWKDQVGPVGELKESWERSFSVPKEIKPARALHDLESCLDGITDDRRALGNLTRDQRKFFRKDCGEIVEELLRLGVCRLAAGLPALGNHTTPIATDRLVTQAFAVAHSQRGRKTRLLTEAGALNARNQLKVEHVLEPETVDPGILDDQSSLILDELWCWVRVNELEMPNFPPNPKYPEDIKEFAEALNSLSRKAGKARPAIALQGGTIDAAGARYLRRWLARMRLEIDVLVRTGESAKEVSDGELELIGPSWRCLKKIEEISND